MPQARVTDVAALPEFRAALATFAAEARQALAEVEVEARRALDWITQDRPAFWQAEIRRSSDAVARAKDELAQSRTYKRIDEYVPSCAEEKKMLALAKQRLEQAERKLEIVKQWGRAAQQAVDKFKGPIQRLSAVFDGDIPRALAVLDRMSDALARYGALGAPAAIPWEELVGGRSQQSVARPEDDAEQTASKRSPARPEQNSEAAAP